MFVVIIVSGRCEEHTDTNITIRMGRETLVLGVRDMVANEVATPLE
jgi:hypothetical protein